MRRQCSCTFETSDNGDLDGYWHLTRVDTLATGGVCEMSERLVFWGVQGHLLNAVDRRSGDANFLLRFDNNGTSLRLYEPYVNDRMVGDIAVDDASLLAPVGINGLDENFAIERLDGDRMTLRGDVLRLDFRKM